MLLQRRDYAIIAAAFLLPTILASLVFVLPEEPAKALTFLTGMWVQVPAVVVGLVVIYRAQAAWRGTIGRALTVMAIGFTMVLLIWTPHDLWHLSNPPMSGWFGLSSGAWTGLYHGLTIGMTFVVAYGYYLFWTLGRPRGDGR